MFVVNLTNVDHPYFASSTSMEIRPPLSWIMCRSYLTQSNYYSICGNRIDLTLMNLMALKLIGKRNLNDSMMIVGEKVL